MQTTTSTDQNTIEFAPHADLKEGVTTQEFLSAYSNLEEVTATYRGARPITSYEKSMHVIINDFNYGKEAKHARETAKARVLELVDLPEIKGFKKRAKISKALTGLAITLREAEAEKEN